MAAVVIAGWSAPAEPNLHRLSSHEARTRDRHQVQVSEDYYLSGSNRLRARSRPTSWPSLRPSSSGGFNAVASRTRNSGFTVMRWLCRAWDFHLLGPPAVCASAAHRRDDRADYIYWTFLAQALCTLQLRSIQYTVPERIALAAGSTAAPLRKLAAVILLLCLAVYAAAQLHAAGINLERALSIDLDTAVLVYLLAIGSYMAIGGFKSSIIASLVHAGLMIATGLIALMGIALALSQAPDPLELFRAAVAAAQGQDSLSLSLFLLQTLSYAAFGLSLGLGLPTFLVRVFALEDTRRIGIAKWTVIGVTHGVVSIMILLGILLHVLVPGIENPELGLIEFANVYMGPLLTGVVLAGIVAAISSTFEALLIILSSAIGADLLGEFIGGRLGKSAARAVRVTITAVVAISVALIALATTATVFEMVIYSVSALTSAFAPVMLVTSLRWRTSPTALTLSMCVGFFSSVAWIALGLDDTFNSVLPASLLALLVHLLAVRLSRNLS